MDVLSEKVKCEQCGGSFFTAYERYHSFKSHRLKEMKFLKYSIKDGSKRRRNDRELCPKCGKSFRDSYNLQRHYTNTHENKPNCIICNFTSFEKEMNQHYEQQHGIVMDVQNHLFNSEQDFIEWKRKVESETYSKYIKGAMRRNKDGSVVIYYRCHRDGFFRSKGNKIRNLKTLGSNKIDSKCPSYMRIRLNDGLINLKYVATHVGHSNDLDRLTLTQDEKDGIARQILTGVPVEEILINIRNSIRNDNIRRIHLITRKDILNIINSYGLTDYKNKPHLLQNSPVKRNDPICDIAISQSSNPENTCKKCRISCDCEIESNDTIIENQDDFSYNEAQDETVVEQNNSQEFDLYDNDDGRIIRDDPLNKTSTSILNDDSVADHDLNRRKLNFIEKMHGLMDLVQSDQDMESVLRHSAPLDSVMKRLKSKQSLRKSVKRKTQQNDEQELTEEYQQDISEAQDTCSILYELVIE